MTFRVHPPRPRGYERSFEPSAGHVELFLRFAAAHEKLGYLEQFQGMAELAPDDVERVRLVLGDPLAQAGALHVLLEHGVRVDPDSLEPGDGRFCARLAQGEERAQAELLVRLEQAERVLRWDPRAPHSKAELEEHGAFSVASGRVPVLIEAAAHGSPEALPRLRAFVRRGDENSTFAWLALGGSREELLALRGNDLMTIPLHDLARAGTLEALRLAVARVERTLDLRPGSFIDGLRYVDALIDRLRPIEPKAVLELLQPALRGCLPRVRDREAKLRLISTLLRAGDPEAIADLERMDVGEVRPAQIVLDDLARAPGDRVVSLLVKLLLSNLAGFPEDDTEEGLQNAVAITQVLQERSTRERLLALQLFDSAPMPRCATADKTVCVRWALGELPAPEQLASLDWSSMSDACGLDLAAEASRYAEVLVELRKDPRKYWWPLALLRDEASAPAFVRESLEPTGKGVAGFRPLLALERIGSPATAEALFAFAAGSQLPVSDGCLSTLAKLDSPANLPRLATLCSRRSAREGQPYWNAFLVLLGRRD